MNREDAIILVQSAGFLSRAMGDVFPMWKKTRGKGMPSSESFFRDCFSSCCKMLEVQIVEGSDHGQCGTGGIVLHFHKWDDGQFYVYVNLGYFTYYSLSQIDTI